MTRFSGPGPDVFALGLEEGASDKPRVLETTATGELKVDATGSTVAGVVTANQGTPGADAWPTIILDSNGNPVDIDSDPPRTGANALVVAQRPPAPAFSVGMAFTVPASAVDIAFLTLAGANAFQLRKIVVWTDVSAGMPLDLVKRTTKNTGGTLTQPTPVPHDGDGAAAQVAAAFYTANPSALGTLAGVLRSTMVQRATPSTFEWTDIRSRAPEIDDSNHIFALSLRAAAAGTENVAISWEFTQQPES